MGVRAAAGLLAALVLTGCAAELAPAGSSFVAGDRAGAGASEKPRTVRAAGTAKAPARTVKITSIRTTNSTKGVITVVGSISPAPAAGTRIPLHQWFPAERRWREVSHGVTRGSSVTITTVQPGSVRTYRIAIGPRAPYAAAYSPSISFKHYVWRGMFKKGVLATGGAGRPQFIVLPRNESPGRSDGELLANKGGHVWGEVNTTGCRASRNWLGNLTDGTVRTSLHNGRKALTSVRQAMESETWLNHDITGVLRLRLQVTDLNSGYGPQVSVYSLLLCTN